MAAAENSSERHQVKPHYASRLVDVIWVVMMLVLLVFAVSAFNARSLCAYMGTDYRGYYTSAQIAMERGFASVYDPELQGEYQAAFSHPCAPEWLPPMERVSMPYLPVFVLLFLPLTAFSVTSGYLVWVAVNLVILYIYLVRFTRALEVRLSVFRQLQWMICLPVIANLYLGQINVFLLVCLGEFTLALLRNQQFRGGLWLGLLLIKPHTLLLLIPGLVISRRWGVVKGFLVSALVIFGGSITISGLDGVRSSLQMAAAFAGPLIQTAATMMNWRALALNLSVTVPDWLAWMAALVGMVASITLVLYLWLRRSSQAQDGTVLLILATYAGTITVAWHSHFYLLVPLIPWLVYLDGRKVMPLTVRLVWLFAPPLWYMLVYLADPASARNSFGLGMLALSLYLLAWASSRLLNGSVLLASTAREEEETKHVQRI
jgi:hypothetical protein